MSEATKKRALILSTFTDAGTGETFTAGDTRMLDAGAHGNYEAAGLVGTPPPATRAPAKPVTKRAAKPAAAPKKKAADLAPGAPTAVDPAPSGESATSEATA